MNRVNWSRAAAVLLCFAALAFTGCRRASFVTPYDVPPGAPTLAQGTLAELDALLEARAPEHATLWVRARVILREPGRRGKAWFDATILYKAPDAVRLRGSRIPIGVLFEVIALGDQAGVYLKRDGELYVGTFGELREQGGGLGALSLGEMMSALLVNQELRRLMSAPAAWRVVNSREDLLLSKPIEDGRVMVWRIRRSDGLVRETILTTPSGEIEARVRYDGYAFTGPDEEPLPSRLAIELAGGQFEVTIEPGEYKLDPELDPRVFIYPSAKSTYPMRLLGRRGSPLDTPAE
ncbi:DUF4292 domain-containing protein [Candidatus Poribacteria bacterium]|nr:DUF4292 domain-containing protein [Candidatus Poribacteria bacterium]